MKSTRFATVVAEAGRPEVHLMLVAPEKDAALQKAIKSHRVMVLHQPRGTGTDFGTVGFEKKSDGQILIFPKSLKNFEGVRIVGVKYELLDDAPTPGKRSSSSRRLKTQVKSRLSSEPSTKGPMRKPSAAFSDKVVHFSTPEVSPEDEEVSSLKDGIRHAMAMLEDGKQVAAFNLLKRLVDR